jgi:hypothetical protein
MSLAATVAGIRFGILSPDLIRKMSVAEIISPDTYKKNDTTIRRRRPTYPDECYGPTAWDP